MFHIYLFISGDIFYIFKIKRCHSWVPKKLSKLPVIKTKQSHLSPLFYIKSKVQFRWAWDGEILQFLHVKRRHICWHSTSGPLIYHLIGMPEASHIAHTFKFSMKFSMKFSLEESQTYNLYLREITISSEHLEMLALHQ